MYDIEDCQNCIYSTKKYSTTGFSQNPEWKGIDREQIDLLLSLMDEAHESLLDPIAFLDKEKVRDNLLQIQKLCGMIADNINSVLAVTR